ncbi:MAG TPA: NAD-dependent epimerase/dehydratase family protein [Streptosporangiaceae bacterium]|nr:NAD-dependent epimerase/dehydratase family protein [Streptosporangiaceae bacterium]
MRILIIGGTAFVGRHIAQTALTAGHDVTLFHRGQTGANLFPQATHLTGNRNEDLSALATARWDATIDVCGYLPGQVRSLAEALDGRGGKHVFISSVSVYRTPLAPGYTEDAPLAELDDPATQEINDRTYGGLKAACERAVTELYRPEGSAIVRPTYVIGPHDYSGRLTWWVERIARGGAVLAPGRPDYPIQVIDARDMAAWIVRLAAGPVTGVFHAASPMPPFGFGDLLEAIAAEVAPPGTRLIWVDPELLLAEGLNDTSLPIWPGADSEHDINAADPSAAFAAGLTPRSLRQSIAEIHSHELTSPTAMRPGVGLTPEREAGLLARWSSSRASEL